MTNPITDADIRMLFRPARKGKSKLPKALSKGEETLARDLDVLKIPFSREYRFHPDRKWLADFLLLNTRFLLEVEGGLYGGRHTRAKGFTDDCEKYNAAAIMGWRVLRFTTDMVTSGEAINVIVGALKA